MQTSEARKHTQLSKAYFDAKRQDVKQTGFGIFPVLKSGKIAKVASIILDTQEAAEFKAKQMTEWNCKEYTVKKI